MVSELNSGSKDVNSCLSENEMQMRLKKFCGLVSSHDKKKQHFVRNACPPSPVSTLKEVKKDNDVGLGICYICYDGEIDEEKNPLLCPCQCKGDTKYVHKLCLLYWQSIDLTSSKSSRRRKQHNTCIVTNAEGIESCSICKARCRSEFTLKNGKHLSLFPKRLEPPFITFTIMNHNSYLKPNNNKSADSTTQQQRLFYNSHFQISFSTTHSSMAPYRTIGRSHRNAMVLNYPTVSNLHAKVTLKEVSTRFCYIIIFYITLTIYSIGCFYIIRCG